ASARGASGRARRAARVPAPGAPAAVHRPLLERARAAADRTPGERRPRRVSLPARIDRPLPVAGRVGGAAQRRRLRDRRDEGAVSVGRRDDGGGVMKLVVAVGGASGSIYAKRLL